MKSIDHESLRTTSGTNRVVFALLSCFVALLAVTPTVAQPTDKCGAVCDELWISGDSPYNVTCDVTVATGCTLTIDANVVVRFQAGTGLLITGSLDVNGTSGNEVTLTSAASSPAVGDWQGLSLLSGSTATIDYAEITYATNGLYANGETATLTGVTSRLNTYGLLVNGQDPPTVNASDCSFTENDLYGVYIQRDYSGPNPLVTITGSSIHSNLGPYDYYAYQNFSNPTETIVPANHNWWGSTDPAVIGPRIYDQSDNGGSPIVDWCRWLDGPGGTPVLDTHCPDLSICDETAVWDQVDKPYVLVSDLIVCPTGTLQVEAGVEVQTVVDSPQPEFRVLGTLDVNGTSGNEVTLTSAASSPAVGDWQGLSLLSGSTATIEHAEITYATNGLYANGETATLTGVTSRLNTYGLLVNGQDPPTVHASDCSFTENDLYGVYIQRDYSGPNPLVTITGSSIHSNLGPYDYYAYQNFSNPTETIVPANHNWWGSTDPAVIGPRIYDQSDNGGSPIVDWCRWLDGPGGTPVLDTHCPDLSICDETAVWGQVDKPYVLVSDLIVCPTGTLQVEAGVEVQTVVDSPQPEFRVLGTLDVNGTSGNEVTLTSAASSPAVGDWQGLSLLSGSTATIEHAEITYATNGLYANGETATLTGVTSRLNTYGLLVNGQDPPTVNASDCSFTENDLYGVYIQRDYSGPNPLVTITGSSIHSNLGPYDYYAYQNFSNPTETIVPANHNWWGSTDPAVIGPRIYDQSDNGGSPIVDWCRWLDGPGGTPVLDTHCPDLSICDETAVWDQVDKPYVLVSDLIVCPTGTLQVEAGVEVQTVVDSPQPEFRVLGTLDVNGTSGNEVTLTSAASSPAVGDWQGLSLLSGSTATIEHAEITYATNGLYANGETATLTGVTSRLNTYGLLVNGQDPPTVHASDCSFTENDLYGVYIQRDYSGPNPLVTITGSSIHSNLGPYDYYAYQNFSNPTETIVPANHNWWGSTDPAVIGPRIYDQSDNGGSPIVDWCRWLDGPGGTPVLDTHCPDLSICDETAVWDQVDKPYVLVSDLIVCPTGTLQVEAGVEVQTVVDSPQPEFRVLGTLDVNGTSGNEVTLTSAASSPAVGDWQGLSLLSGSTATIEHAEITYATNGLYANGETATLTGVTSRLNTYGLLVNGQDPPTVNASDCSFTENDLYGVYIQRDYSGPNPLVTITGSSIHSNLGPYDYYAYQNFSNPTETIVPANHNWWGSTDPAVIGPRIYDQSDNGGSPIVDWCRWLDGPGGTPVLDTHCPDLSICDETAVWDQVDKPYVLVSDLIVCPTGTLQVEAGVEVQTVVDSPQPEFRVLGTLDVNGTSGNEVTLTSAASSPAVGDWQGLSLLSGSTATIEHAEITYATNGLYANGETATLTGVTSRLNTYGLLVNGQDPPTVNASDCSFTENDLYGVYIQRDYSGPNPLVTITGSSIHSNLGPYDYYAYQNFSNPTETVLMACDNWWGTTLESGIRQRIHDYEDNHGSPRVYHRALGEACEWAVAEDQDGDRVGDFDDNCPIHANADQIDTDSDRMGDSCDPYPNLQPVDLCDGIGDVSDGYADADADGWGDPCDFQPTRDDSYPGATEICDGRDNDGDGLLAMGGEIDKDLDEAIACGDCDDFEPEVFPCACEDCINLRDDNCNDLMDGADPECFENPYCITVVAGTPEPALHVSIGTCDAATESGPFEVIRGHVGGMRLAGGSVDLGDVHCVEGGLLWDRVTDTSPDPNPNCNDTLLYFVARDIGAADFGFAWPGGEPRDVMNPDPVCP